MCPTILLVCTTVSVLLLYLETVSSLLPEERRVPGQMLLIGGRNFLQIFFLAPLIYSMIYQPQFFNTTMIPFPNDHPSFISTTTFLPVKYVAREELSNSTTCNTLHFPSLLELGTQSFLLLCQFYFNHISASSL